MWDRMQVFCEKIADHQIRLVLHFDKILDEKIFKRALEITLKNNPITCANYVEKEKDAFWEFPEINIDDIYTFKLSQKSEQLIRETILKRIDTYTGPQIKISLIRSETDVLILNCNHSITDAAGVKEFMYELTQNYNCISQENTGNYQSYIPSRSLKVLSKQLSIKEKIDLLGLMLSGKKSAPTFQKLVDLDDLQKPGFKTYTYNPSEFKRIKEFGKQHNATVNDVLLVIFFFTLKRISGNSNQTNRLAYSSDLRKFLEQTDYDTLSNFSAIHNIDIDNNSDDFLEILKKVSAFTKKRKQKRYNLVDFPMMVFLFKLLSYQKCKNIFHNEFNKIRDGKSNASPSLSNIGILEEEKLNFNKLVPVKAYVLGGINHPGLLQLVTSTYRNYLTISIGSYFNEKNEVYFSGFMEELKMVINEKVV